MDVFEGFLKSSNTYEINYTYIFAEKLQMFSQCSGTNGCVCAYNMFEIL